MGRLQLLGGRAYGLIQAKAYNILKGGRPGGDRLLCMRTLLDRENLSSINNGQVAARRVTGLIYRMALVVVKKVAGAVYCVLFDLFTISCYYRARVITTVYL